MKDVVNIYYFVNKKEYEITLKNFSFFCLFFKSKFHASQYNIVNDFYAQRRQISAIVTNPVTNANMCSLKAFKS